MEKPTIKDSGEFLEEMWISADEMVELQDESGGGFMYLHDILDEYAKEVTQSLQTELERVNNVNKELIEQSDKTISGLEKDNQQLREDLMKMDKELPLLRRHPKSLKLVDNTITVRELREKLARILNPKK